MSNGGPSSTVKTVRQSCKYSLAALAGAYPYIKYHCTLAPPTALHVYDTLFTLLKLVNLRQLPHWHSWAPVDAASHCMLSIIEHSK